MELCFLWFPVSKTGLQFRVVVVVVTRVCECVPFVRVWSAYFFSLCFRVRAFVHFELDFVIEFAFTSLFLQLWSNKYCTFIMRFLCYLSTYLFIYLFICLFVIYMFCLFDVVDQFNKF